MKNSARKFAGTVAKSLGAQFLLSTPLLTFDGTRNRAGTFLSSPSYTRRFADIFSFKI